MHSVSQRTQYIKLIIEAGEKKIHYLSQEIWSIRVREEGKLGE
jgi:hypothetical protein